METGTRTGTFIGDLSRDDTTKWDIEAVGAQMGFLQGEVLTIVEATLTGTQLKATKDLVKRAFRDRIGYMRNISLPGRSTEARSS